MNTSAATDAHAPRDATTRTLTRSYPGTPDQASAVRADLQPLLHDCPCADDIILCASELAANAATHSDSAQPGGTFTLHADIRPGSHVRIEVADDGGLWINCSWGRDERPRHPDRPHGLDLVAALATWWGITSTNTGRNVWLITGWHQTDISAAGTGNLPPAPDRHGNPRPNTTILSGDRLRQARRMHGLSRERLAWNAGIGITTINRLERHPHSPIRIRTLYALAATLRQTPADLTPQT